MEDSRPASMAVPVPEEGESVERSLDTLLPEVPKGPGHGIRTWGTGIGNWNLVELLEH